VLKDRGQSALNLFYRSDKVVVAMLIRDSEVSASKIAVTKEVERKLEDYQQNLQRPIDDQKKEWYDLSKGLGISAEHVVPSELLSQALQSKSLVIVPHGILHLLPWAGLTFNGKRLFEYCPIGILPNLSCILSLNANFSFRPQVALIGSPDYGTQDKDNKDKDLPWTQFEIEELEDIYYIRSGIIEKSMKDKEATEENFWKLANSQNAEGGILHIACHGKFDVIDPMNSGLLLTNSKADAAEIAMSSLKFNEVILSACSTGIRPTQVQNVKLIADDIIGLPGAFLEAGVKSLLVSIPPSKDDVAFTFMVLYHKNRLEGKAPLFALRETQKTMLNEYSMHQPYNWIGFTIYGYQ
jgi:CHAT domain-containing protein